jgi:hypothetical protein
MEMGHQIVAVQNTFKNSLIFHFYFVLSLFLLLKDAKTSPLETAKAVEPTAIPSSDEVSTTVPGTRLVVAHPDDPVSLKIQRRPSKELAAKKVRLLFEIYF